MLIDNHGSEKVKTETNGLSNGKKIIRERTRKISGNSNHSSQYINNMIDIYGRRDIILFYL